ncbi:hypothetical protein B0H14DRAFT_3866066 [Mycena olivaceomarginata]|nr:hypothetical protein B0H14DRAFT_3866066 [Mycena olivaceomarginata]
MAASLRDNAAIAGDALRAVAVSLDLAPDDGQIDSMAADLKLLFGGVTFTLGVLDKLVGRCVRLGRRDGEKTRWVVRCWIRTGVKALAMCVEGWTRKR